ncbi:murein transglycosylase [Flavobacterium akiainvivens]|uniref:Murein transglycosylase n=1 Tax=Flavobacterium akiainvivens TaxID=1202724 RepID=A0A0M9VI50_9FLAO|nr:lytic transglycosylase domain-containing protein [Flavobacterium akiainvivens]KOS06276.1 murein transglycosylase [Flavobacterium akiainvivens]SFQ17364.1 Transglycosylase SLT domain-containing protein [Flavobacterium akiainvivens]
MEWIKKSGVMIGAMLVGGAVVHTTYQVKKDEPAKAVTGNYFPAEIDFAGEKTPLNISDVRERLDRELLTNANLHATTQIIIKRANRAFPVMEPILKQYGIPDDFKYLAVIESGLVNVVSPAKAAGVWQFMPDTGKQYGLEVTDLVDERYHLAKSTEAACKYLLAAKAKFGSWTLAAASYNAGVAGINRHLNFQGVTNYYDLALVEETSRYVFRILALKEIMKHPANYNFNIPAADLYKTIPVKTVEVSANVPDLAVFAKEQGINYKILKIHNPWLRDHNLNVAAGKKYTLEIPTSGY